jgi:hypothetical protein
MVFDGNVNPERVWYQANLDQDYAFDRNMDVFFAWVARYDSVYHLGTTGRAVKKKYYATEQQLRRTPAGGLIGPSELNDIFLSAGYSVYTWETIAAAFSAWVNEADPAPLVELYAPPEPGADNGLRDLPRHRVHRRAVAAELVEVEARQLAGVRQGAVRDLGQRVVQRALPVLGREGRQAGRGERQEGTADPADQ